MGIKRSQMDQVRKGDIALLGLPWDQNSSFLQGPALAPPRIIEALEIASANYFTESLTDLNNHPHLHWVGNADLHDYFDIEKVTMELLDQGSTVFSLGGDHSVTYPIINSLSKKFDALTILHFDAHGDLYDELDGNKLSHACPFARIMENGLAKRLVQVGIRTMTQHQKEQADRFGVEVIQMKDISQAANLTLDGPVYLSFDLDVLDPAFVPGVSHYEPGGLSTREALTIIQNFQGNIVGADLVEYNPLRDVNGMTAMVAAKVLKEIVDKMLN